MKKAKLIVTIALWTVVSLLSAKEKPNVIILLADDQGYGDLSCHGNPHLKTANLDRLYEESIRFTDFHASSICTPTRSQLLTGIDAVRNGAYNFGYGKSTIFTAIPDGKGSEQEVHLISDHFRENDYVTGHFGKWHLGDLYPYRSIDRGFDSALTFPSASVWQASNYWNNDGFDDWYYRDGELVQTEGYCNDLWFDETMTFIREAQKKSKPFFVYLATSSMHTPLFAPAKYSEPYENMPDLTKQFYGMIANFDENFGRLDNFLEKHGLKENTILIYMSDNGGTFGVQQFNAGMQGQKGKLWDGGHRVQCFLRWPNGGLDAGSDIDDLVVVQDILPTLIDLCGLKDSWNDKIDGISVAPRVLGEAQDISGRMSVVQFSTRRRGLNGYAVLWKKWRLLNSGDLYHVGVDPGQKNDVSKDYPEVKRLMLDYYKQWSRSVQPSLEKETQIDIGYFGFESVDLSCFDWLDLEGDGNPSQQYDVRQGMSMHGYWNLNFHEGGVYRFVARRWPREAGAAITAGLPAYVTEYAKQVGNTDVPSREELHNWGDLSTGGIYPVGEALDIVEAKFSVGGSGETKRVLPGDKYISFECEMNSGVSRLQIDFLNQAGEIECGAYYVEISRVR